MTKPVLKLKDVFTPGGQPTLTYVSRDHLKLEEKLEAALARGFAVNVVTGPTKSGKTVLSRRVLPSDALISIEGGQVRSEADFWKQVAFKLNLASTVQKTGSDEVSNQLEVAGGAKAEFLGVGVNGAAKNVSGTKSVDGRSATYDTVDLISSLEALKSRYMALLIDDFHYLDKPTQKAIIQSLKGAVYDGLSVILLAVPHRAFDPITVEHEMEGRFKHIQIPDWSQVDLSKIPDLGFEALNVSCPQKAMDRICSESFGNPLLVQEICTELCIANDVFGKQDTAKRLSTDKLEEIFSEIAQSKGFPKYERLKKGPQSRGGRQARKFKDDTSADIYAAILRAIARLGPKSKTTYDEIRSSLKDILADGQVPQKHEISAACAHMTKIAKDQLEGEPALEWLKGEDLLVLTDPFLMFYMKWAFKDDQALGA